MASKTVIVEGSHRYQGHTGLLADYLASKLPAAHVVSLLDYDIGHYTYDHRYRNDDFLSLLRELSEYDTIVAATPIYWYAMSGRMKVFFDRITDSMQIDKPLGRSLAGKGLAAFSCGSEDTLPQGFFEPFRLTAGYLDMQYLGNCHTWMEDGIVNSQSSARLTSLASQLTA